MAKSLQTRSKTIRRAIQVYNKAAADLVPPRPPLNWADVSHYGLIEQYAMLRASNIDLGSKHWSQPVYREILKCRRRIARAQEEITRCNVEACRLHTSIYDNTSHFKKTVKRLKDENSPMCGAVGAFVLRQNRIHRALLKRVHQIYGLVGFTGTPYRGVSILQHGNATPTNDDDDDVGDSGLTLIVNEDDGDDDGERDESDDEVHIEMDNLGGFMSNVHD